MYEGWEVNETEFCVCLGALVLEILNLWVLLPMLSTFPLGNWWMFNMLYRLFEC